MERQDNEIETGRIRRDPTEKSKLLLSTSTSKLFSL